MASYTTLFHLGKPTVGGDADVWGTILNTVIEMLDAALGFWTITGSSSAYVLTTGFSLPSYANGQRFFVKWNHTNASTSPTLNVDGLGAKAIKKRDGTTSPSASDLVSGRYNEVIYDGTNMVLNEWVASDFQPLDATLTALAALSYTSGTLNIQMTAADTFALASDALNAKLAGTSAFTAQQTIDLGTASGTIPTPLAGTVLQLSNVTGTGPRLEFDAYQANANFTARRAQGTRASPTAVQADQALFSIGALGYGATGFASAARVAINLYAAENWTDSAQGTYGVMFSTPKLSASQAATYRWGSPESSIELGYRDGGPGSVKTADYTFALTDRGTPTDHNNGSAHAFTVPPEASVAWPDNSILYGLNIGAGALTLTRGSGVTFRDAAGTDANLTVAQYQGYVARKIGTNTWSVRLT